MNIIDINKIKTNMLEMINLLEYDAMRSPGKAKMNSQHLHSLYYLVDLYEQREVKVKSTPTKKEG